MKSVTIFMKKVLTLTKKGFIIVMKPVSYA